MHTLNFDDIPSADIDDIDYKQGDYLKLLGKAGTWELVSVDPEPSWLDGFLHVQPGKWQFEASPGTLEYLRNGPLVNSPLEEETRMQAPRQWPRLLLRNVDNTNHWLTVPFDDAYRVGK